MRIVFISILIVFVAISNGTLVNAQSFNRTLKVGSRGEDVRELQKMLNSDYSTRILGNGPGSIGKETLYFGALTQDAVIRFQEKYAGQILTPNGLSAGTGIVGRSTRATLIAMSDSPPIVSPPPISIGPSEPTVPPASSPTPAPSYITPTPQSPGPTPQPTNPNLKNIDRLFATIDRVQGKQGLSASAISNIKKQIVKELATTTDLRATFLKQVQNKSRQSVNNDPGTGGLLAMIRRSFEFLFVTEHAYAQGSDLPFGGELLFSFYCEDSANWWLTIVPFPPDYVAELSYYEFSQAHLSFNIPLTTWLLGKYEPGGICVFGCPYCVEIETEGTITPTVGSSAM